MPSAITSGSRVWANIGPLQEGSAPRLDPSTNRKKKARRTRIRLHGTVIQSCGSPPNNLWRVYWDECGRTSDHRPVTLHLDKGAVPTQMSPEAVQQQLTTWLNLPGIYIGNHDAMMEWTANNFNVRSTLSSPNMRNDSANASAPPHVVTGAPVPPPTTVPVPSPTTAPTLPTITPVPPTNPPVPPTTTPGALLTPPAVPGNNPDVLLRAEEDAAYFGMPPLLPPTNPDDSDDDSDDEDNGARGRAWPGSNAPVHLETDTFDPNEVERESTGKILPILTMHYVQQLT